MRQPRSRWDCRELASPSQEGQTVDLRKHGEGGFVAAPKRECRAGLVRGCLASQPGWFIPRQAPPVYAKNMLVGRQQFVNLSTHFDFIVALVAHCAHVFCICVHTIVTPYFCVYLSGRQSMSAIHEMHQYVENFDAV